MAFLIITKKPQTMDLFTSEEMHSLENLRGIPNEINSELHLQKGKHPTYHCE